MERPIPISKIKLSRVDYFEAARDTWRGVVRAVGRILASLAFIVCFYLVGLVLVAIVIWAWRTVFA